MSPLLKREQTDGEEGSWWVRECVSVPVGSYGRVHESSGLGVDEPLEGGALAATRCLWLGAEAWRERVPPSGQGGREAWVDEGLARKVGARATCKDFAGRERRCESYL